jgi:hypothetical protein
MVQFTVTRHDGKPASFLDKAAAFVFMIALVPIIAGVCICILIYAAISSLFRLKRK